MSLDILKRVRFKSRQFILLVPLFILIGKLVRWTLMKSTLVDMSQGHGYPDAILNRPWSFSLFGIDELVEGNIGQGDNVITFFKIIRKICLNIPTDFYSFEVCITILLGIIMFLILTKTKPLIDLLEASFIALVVMVNSVYCFSLGKEAFQMIYFIALFLCLKSEYISPIKKLLLSIGIILISVATFRTYYALIVLFIIVIIACFMFVLSYTEYINWSRITLILVLVSLFYLLMMGALMIINGSLYRLFHDSLLYSSAATASSNTYIDNLIVPYLGDNLITLWMEYVLVIIRLSIPIELIVLGVKYWPFVLYQSLMTYYAVKSIVSIRENLPSQNIALIIYMAFLFASASFEVDFGAWIRHCAVTFPVLLIMTQITDIEGDLEIPFSEEYEEEEYKEINEKNYKK